MLAVQMVQAVLKDAKMRDHADVIQCEVGMLMGRSHELVEHVKFDGCIRSRMEHVDELCRGYRETVQGVPLKFRRPATGITD